MTSSAYGAAPFATWVDLARWRARETPDQTIYTFLPDRSGQTIRWSCSDLDRRARGIAALLQQHIGVGERVLLMYPPGLEYIAALFGCLYAGVIAVPAYPPSPTQMKRAAPRVRTILRDAQPRVVLSTESIRASGRALTPDTPELQAVDWLTTDSLDTSSADAWSPLRLDGGTAALIQYTSGSTAAPKGVLLTHAHLLHNSALIQHSYDHTSEEVGVSWLPFYHDMGLIGGVFQPLYVGAQIVLLSPTSFLQQPIRWLETITRFRGTSSGAPNFAYDLCVRRISSEQLAALDLSHWRVAPNGAEPIRPETLRAFTDMFAVCGLRAEAFCPSYGMAETTLLISCSPPSQAPTLLDVDAAALEQNRVEEAAADQTAVRTLVGCGAPAGDQQLLIVNPDSGRCCADDEVGEIWVSGPSVAAGYWGQTQASEATFHAYTSDTGAGPFLRTGDLGFVHQGELFITGRCKDLIIIRGRNLYPQDVELTAEQSHPAIQPNGCAAFSTSIDGEERLIILVEIERRYRPGGTAVELPASRILDGETVIKAVRRAVVEQHDVLAHAVVLLRSRGIPRTSSGKVQRRACQAAFQASTLDCWGVDPLSTSELVDEFPRSHSAA